jgi:flagellin
VDLAIQNLATLRANNGAEQQRMTFAADMLAINKVNLESANSRIADVDIAAESANLARLNILQQAGTAMLAQANMASQSVLRLLV